MQGERSNFMRSRAYSAWHRRHSAKRFVGIEAAQRLAMVEQRAGGPAGAALYIKRGDGGEYGLRC